MNAKSKLPVIIVIAVLAVILVAGGIILALDATEKIDFIDLISSEKENEEGETSEEGTSGKTSEDENILHSEGATEDKPSVQEDSSSSEAETTTDGEEPSTALVPPAGSEEEYDVLRSGYCYISGSMTDSSGFDAPMEMAISPDSLYMLSEFEGTEMGMIVKSDSIYMIYTEKKAYLKLAESEMEVVGMSMDEFNMAEGIDFDTLPELDEAEKTSEVTHNGHNCTVYHFVNADGSEKRVYMDGKEVIRIADFTSSGSFLSATDIDVLTATIPEGKIDPPADYTAYEGLEGMFEFFMLLEDFMM